MERPSAGWSVSRYRLGIPLGFRSAGVVFRRQGFTDSGDDGSRRKKVAMSASTLRDMKHAEVATKHGQVTRTLNVGACAVLTNGRAGGG
jgi:hypothetical protein